MTKQNSTPASPEQVAKNIIKDETLINYGDISSFLPKFSKNFGTSAISSSALQ